MKNYLKKVSAILYSTITRELSTVGIDSVNTALGMDALSKSCCLSAFAIDESSRVHRIIRTALNPSYFQV